LGLRCALLVGAAALAGGAAAWWQSRAGGGQAMGAALAAVGICLAGAVPALLLTAWWKGTPHAAMGSALLGMLFRMGIPLAAVMILHRPGGGGELLAAGIVGSVLIVYPVTLLTEVALAVSLLSQDERRPSLRSAAAVSTPSDAPRR